MAIFGPNPWVNPFGKMSILRLFKLLLFIAQKGVFSLQNIVKDIFLPCITKKKKVGKMAIFGPKPWVNPFGKLSIIRPFKLLVFIAQKGVFGSRISLRIFFWPILPKKKELGKMAIFGPKPWVNPFGKMSIFRLFQLVVFIAQKGLASFQDMVKDICLPYIA